MPESMLRVKTDRSNTWLKIATKPRAIVVVRPLAGDRQFEVLVALAVHGPDQILDVRLGVAEEVDRDCGGTAIARDEVVRRSQDDRVLLLVLSAEARDLRLERWIVDRESVRANDDDLVDLLARRVGRQALCQQVVGLLG